MKIIETNSICINNAEIVNWQGLLLSNNLGTELLKRKLITRQKFSTIGTVLTRNTVGYTYTIITTISFILEGIRYFRESTKTMDSLALLFQSQFTCMLFP